MKRTLIVCFLTLLTHFALPVSAQENKVVVVPLAARTGPGDWKTVSVSAFAGMPEHYLVQTSAAFVCGHQGPYAHSGADPTRFLIVPVQLPDGATITSFSAVICDNTATYHGSMILYRSDNKFITVAQTTVAEMSTTPFTKSATSIADAYKVVDNSQYSYFIYMAVNSVAQTNLYPIAGIVGLE